MKIKWVAHHQIIIWKDFISPLADEFLVVNALSRDGRSWKQF